MRGRLLALLLAWGSTVGFASFDRPSAEPGRAEVCPQPADAQRRAPSPVEADGRSAELGTSAAPPAFQQDPGRAAKFTHAQHVSEIWFNENTAETFRDCRGCHRFDAEHPVSAPQQECDACHLPGNLTRQFLDGWQNDLAGYRTRTRDAFRHHTHGMLECRECHLPVNTNFLRDFDIVTGPAQCARCHDAAQVAKDDHAEVRGLRWFTGAADEAAATRLGVPFRKPPTDLPAYAKVLVEAFAGPSGGVNTTRLPVGGDFDHYDHGDIACRDCHTNITVASAKEVGTGKIPSDGCAKCHQSDAQATGARVSQVAKKELRPLWSLGAFVHADHYRFLAPGATRKPDVATAAAYDLLANSKTGACEVCHTQDPAAIGTTQRDFPFAAGQSRHRYLDCVVCHDVGAWRTGETAAAPLHDSTDGAADGVASGWTACASCHVFGSADFRSARPQVAVTRATGRTFEFSVHTHPDITQRGIDASGRQALADCKSCHRARVPELPSRLERRAFRHATHLPAAATEQDCRGCHPLAVTAADAVALGGGDFRTYTLAGCATCHLGSTVQEVDGPAPAPREVVAFPHGPHTKAGAKCTDCHELAGDGADVTTKAKALACNQCHDHQAGGPQAERLFGEPVKSCAACHDEVPAAGGAPQLAVPAARGTPAAAVDPRYRAEQSTFAGFVDSQFHPLGGTCTDCHRAVLQPDPKWPGLRVPRADHLFGTSKSPHANAARKQPAECLRCHWKPIDGLDAGVDAGSTEERFFRKNPTDQRTRDAYGNDNLGYPGTNRARG